MARNRGFAAFSILFALGEFSFLVFTLPSSARMNQKCDDAIEIAQRENASDHKTLVEIADRCIRTEPTDEFYRHVKGVSEYRLGRIEDAIATMKAAALMQEAQNDELKRPWEQQGMRLGMTYWFLTTFLTYKSLFGVESTGLKAEVNQSLTELYRLAGCADLSKTPVGSDNFLNQDERLAICLDALHVKAWLYINDDNREMGCKMLSGLKGKAYDLPLSPLDPKEMHASCESS